MIHNVGENHCPFCAKNVGMLSKFVDKVGTHLICRPCYRKATGKNTRIELVMSKYLDENYGTEFLISSDQRIWGNLCQKYRPDKLYASPGIVKHVECDEQQHNSHFDYTCEEERILNMYGEFPGQDYLVIRWNPHWYLGINYSIEERLQLLLSVLTAQIVIENKILIIYMFYDENNPVITQKIEKHFVNCHKNLEDIL